MRSPRPPSSPLSFLVMKEEKTGKPASGDCSEGAKEFTCFPRCDNRERVAGPHVQKRRLRTPESGTRAHARPPGSRLVTRALFSPDLSLAVRVPGGRVSVYTSEMSLVRETALSERPPPGGLWCSLRARPGEGPTRSLGTALVRSSDMTDGNGLLCCCHGEHFSLNTKDNVDIVTKLDGSHMVWRNQVESVRG